MVQHHRFIDGTGVVIQPPGNGQIHLIEMSYAGKLGIPFVLLLGEDEINQGKVSLKNMTDERSSVIGNTGTSAGAVSKSSLRYP